MTRREKSTSSSSSASDPLVAARRQKNPARDARLTSAFHRRLSRLNVPHLLVDGVKWNSGTHPLDWPGWPMVRVDIRMLK